MTTRVNPIKAKPLFTKTMVSQQKHNLFLITTKTTAGKIKLHYLQEEMALVLLAGSMQAEVGNQTYAATRINPFDAKGACLSVGCNQKVTVTLQPASKVLLITKTNKKPFASVFYPAEKVPTSFFGEGMWNNSANRYVSVYFDYSNAPFSNLVVGEVLNFGGTWTSYLPHNHPHPETYFFQFDHPQGFGFQGLSNKAQVVYHDSVACIKPHLYHPNVGAPGYAMQYVWIIPHLKNLPWQNTREFQAEHKWLLDPNARVWKPNPL